MAIKRAPVAWVSPTPWGMAHVVTDAQINFIYFVGSIPLLPTSFRNGPESPSAGNGMTTPAGERTFNKWWNFVWFELYSRVYARYANTERAKQVQAIHPSFITILDLPADPLDEDIPQAGWITALGLQGEGGELDPLILALFKDYHDPFRDPAYN